MIVSQVAVPSVLKVSAFQTLLHHTLLSFLWDFSIASLFLDLQTLSFLMTYIKIINYLSAIHNIYNSYISFHSSYSIHEASIYKLRQVLN